MTQVDFYQLSRDPAEQVVPLLAGKVLQSGERLVVVSGDAAQREVLSKALWEQGGAAFLAHGDAGGPHEERQPILLSEACAAANGATIGLIADGKWREEAAAFERALLLFGPEDTAGARALWSTLSRSEEYELRIFKQRGDGGWREGR